MAAPYPSFPASPTIGQTYTDANGAVWTFGNIGWTKTLVSLTSDPSIWQDIDSALSYDSSGNVTIAGGLTAGGKVSIPLGTAPLPSLYFGTDINTGIYSPGADQVGIATNGTSRLVVDASGRLLVGATNSRQVNASINALQFQIEGTTYQSSSMSLVTNQNAADGSYIVLGKSRGASLNSSTIVNSGDSLGAIWFCGADGNTMPRSAVIEAFVDATPGASDMPGRLVFSTTADGAASPTPRMTIKNSGNIHFNDFTDTDVSNNITSAFIAATGRWIYSGKNADTVLDVNQTFDDTNARSAVRFYRNETQVGSISVSTTATAYNINSDYRLKQNITPVVDGISRLQQLKPCRFNFIAEPDTEVDGFIAHEVQFIVPEAITGEKDAVNADGVPIYQSIDQSKLIPLLTAALQEAIAKIESLESRLTAAGI